MKAKSLIVIMALFCAITAMATSTELTPVSRFQVSVSGVEYNDVWGYTAPDGREYALLGVDRGTSIIDLADPTSPKEITFIPSNRSIWKDIKTYQHYAYTVNESGGGLQIIDLSELPEKATLVATFTGFSTSHNIFIDTKRALLFAEGTHSEPVRIYSLENPLQPKLLSVLGVECHDIVAQDGMLYVSEGGHGTIGIFNYDDPSNPVLVKRFKIKRAGYVHNAWPTADGRYLMTTEENTGKTMKLFDLSDLGNVTLRSEVIGPGKLAHNTHIKGNYAYVSHYGSGFRLYDITNPDNMKEIAFWQRQETPERGFVSAWGAYPFFKSGYILVSDIERGLVVLYHESAKE